MFYTRYYLIRRLICSISSANERHDYIFSIKVYVLYILEYITKMLVSKEVPLRSMYLWLWQLCISK